MFFLEFFCFFYNPTDVGNFISGSSAFCKSSLNIWKFSVHVLLKLHLENFEHYFASMWKEYNCAVVWAFFGTYSTSKAKPQSCLNASHHYFRSVTLRALVSGEEAHYTDWPQWNFTATSLVWTRNAIQLLLSCSILLSLSLLPSSKTLFCTSSYISSRFQNLFPQLFSQVINLSSNFTQKKKQPEVSKTSQCYSCPPAWTQSPVLCFLSCCYRWRFRSPSKVKWESLHCVQLFATPWTIQSVEFSRPEYRSG